MAPTPIQRWACPGLWPTHTRKVLGGMLDGQAAPRIASHRQTERARNLVTRSRLSLMGAGKVGRDMRALIEGSKTFVSLNSRLESNKKENK